SRETLDEAIADTLQCLRCLRGEPLSDLLSLIHEEGETAVSPYPSVQSGVAMAVTMAAGAGEPQREHQALNALLAGDVDAVQADAAFAREAGFLAAKLKVGRETIEEDIA